MIFQLLEISSLRDMRISHIAPRIRKQSMQETPAHKPEWLTENIPITSMSSEFPLSRFMMSKTMKTIIQRHIYLPIKLTIYVFYE